MSGSKQYIAGQEQTYNLYPTPAYHPQYHRSLHASQQYSWGQRTIIRSNVPEGLTITAHCGKRRLVSTTPGIDASKEHSQKSFTKWANDEFGGLVNQIEFMSMGQKESNGEESAAKLFIEFLSRKYPRTFESFIEEKGMKTKLKRMDPVQTCALQSDAGLSYRQLNKIHQHIQHHTGSPLFCPRDDLFQFTNDCPESEVITQEITHKDESVETIYILMQDLEKYICAEMDREIRYSYKSYQRSRTDPMFGYALLASKITDGIYTMLGTDHGKDFCQFAIRLMLGTPEDRRRSMCADYETKTINFCTIKCKKDTHQILELTKQNVNNALNVLKNKQLVGIEDMKGRVKTLFIEKGLKLHSAKFDPNDSDLCILICDRNGTRVEIKTEANTLDRTTRTLHPFKIIETFHNFQCGDYAAQFLLQGRPGMSGCRCMHCNLTRYEWNDMERCTTIPRILTFNDIKDGKNNDVGNTKIPTYEYDPLDCLSPILHGEIGTGNKQIDSSLIPLLIEIDSASPQEYQMLSQQHDLNCRISCIDEKLAEFGRNSNSEELNAMKKRRGECKKKRKQVVVKLEKAQKSTYKTSADRICKYSDELRLLDDEISKVEVAVTNMENTHLRTTEQLKKEKKLLNEKRKVVSSNLEQEHTKRNRKGGSLVSRFNGILKKNSITVQAYHGGSLTGKHVVRFMKQRKDIFRELRNACLERIDERKDMKEESEHRPIPDKEYVIVELMKNEELFNIQDCVYSSLRIICPTDEEYNMTEFFMDELKTKWKAMGLSITCKMHFNFDHVCDQQRRVGGLGDKSEDWLEREHQAQLKYNRVTFGMKPKQALKLQAKLKWRAGNPLIREQIARVRANFTQGLEDSEWLSVTELAEVATTINKDWKDKYGSLRSLKRKYVGFRGAQAEGGAN